MTRQQSAEEIVKRNICDECTGKAYEAIGKARQEGYEQAEDDYDIVTPRDRAWRELSEIGERK